VDFFDMMSWAVAAFAVMDYCGYLIVSLRCYWNGLPLGGG
jgi:hypothetical protein